MATDATGYGTGRLQKIIDALGVLAGFFYNLMVFCDAHPVFKYSWGDPPKSLGGFFWNVYLNLYGTQNDLVVFKDKYTDLINAVLSRLASGDLWDALTLIWPQSYWIRVSPIDWLVVVTENIIPDSWHFWHDTIWWVVNRIELRWPGLALFAASPRAWLDSWLIENTPLLYYVRRGEWHFVHEALYLMYPWTKWIFDDFGEWLKFRVGDILGVEYRFWYDPVGYIKEYIIAQRDTWTRNSSGWIKTIGESVLRYLIEGAW